MNFYFEGLPLKYCQDQILSHIILFIIAILVAAS